MCKEMCEVIINEVVKGLPRYYNCSADQSCGMKDIKILINYKNKSCKACCYDDISSVYISVE